MHRSGKARAISGLGAIIEAVEPRLMLSGSHLHKKTPKPPKLPKVDLAKPTYMRLDQTDGKPLSTMSPYGNTLPVNAVRDAYGFGTYNTSGAVTYGGIQGTGAGQTIAIVDAYDYPTISTDMAAFDAYYGLPAPPSLVRVSETGSTTALPTVDTVDPPGNTWEGEESLDVEWAHAMAPLANIVLVETDSASDLFDGVGEADSYPGVTSVSMSWVVGEAPQETEYDSYYFHTPGITYVGGAGDSGAAANYPAASPDVLSVGGTSLSVTGSNASGYTYAGETAWSGSGGGVSTQETIPTYQVGNNNGTSTTNRTIPDVAAIADPNTPVAVYDSYDNGTAYPWSAVGGTSVATPIWAATIAVVNQGRSIAGLSPLDTSSPTQTLTKVYQLGAADFHDITSGSNGNPAGPGYDLVTGRGSDNGSRLLYDLAGVGTVTGKTFVDTTGTGVYTAGDKLLSGVKLYLDLNGNGTEDPLETSTAVSTAANGTYSISDQVAGGAVRLTGSAPAGYVLVTPAASTALAYSTTDTINLAFFANVYSTVNPSVTYTLQTDSTGTYDQILQNGSQIGQVLKANLPALTFNLTGSGDVLVVNAANGNPIPGGGITVTGSSNYSDYLRLIGGSGNDSIAVSSSAVTFSSTTINYTNLHLVLLPGTGVDSLAVNSGSALLAAANAGSGILTRRFSSLTIGATGTLDVGTATAYTDRTLLLTAGLNIAAGGVLDLGGNDMAVEAGAGVTGSLASVTALAATGDQYGSWNGTGLASAAAAANASHLTALGVAPGSVIAAGTTFDGYTPASNDVLVKYTYYGDANLDGKVDGSDYSVIDANYGTTATGWYKGDFNYDAAVDGSDYSLIDNAYNNQSGNP